MSHHTTYVELSRSALHGNRRSAAEYSPFFRGNVPDSVDDVIEVPVPLTGNEHDEEIRVLHVDDHSELTKLTKLYLEETGEEFTVVSATNAVKALELFQSQEFDCIVSDYEMPNTDGLELLQIVRETHPNFPFILFTAKGNESIASEAFSKGATDYMQKEIGSSQYDILAERVRSAVDQYRMQQQFWNALSWYHQLVEQNLLGVFVVEDGEFLYVNERFTELVGYRSSDLLGKRPTELASTSADEELLAALEEADPCAEETFHLTTTVRHRDGSDIPVEIQAGAVHQNDSPGCIGIFWERRERC